MSTMGSCNDNPVSTPAPAPAPPVPNNPPNEGGTRPPSDPNLANPRLLTNGACIYERHLPGNAHITAHVQRLQHGYYASPAVSDKDSDHVDFLAISFVFHSPNTLAHRFRAATIRASVCGNRKMSMSSRTQAQPRFLMHAPHLLYGAVSPETLQWDYGLAGTLGISQFPVSASLIPSGAMRGRYRRYEMMRIQGSVRTLKSTHGRQFDVESGEIVWSLEENSLQKSGLPREFTFAMLIQKPRAESRVAFSLEIDPVIQSWYGGYPRCWLSLARYQPVQRRSVDFKKEIGQKFEPAQQRFNFATLESSFDDYVYMPGRKFTSGTSPDGGQPLGDDNELNPGVVRGMVKKAVPTPMPGPGPQANLMPPFPMLWKMPLNAPTGLMPPLNVRVLLDTTPTKRAARERRKSNPEKAPQVTRWNERPVRRTKSGEVLYQ